VTLTRFGRLFLLAAFLLAQQGALGHEVWHAGKAGQAPDKAYLCDFHAALGTVTGGLNGAASNPALVDLQGVDFIAGSAALISAFKPAPASRGPPQLL
jgi:hypothetical protein